MRRKRRRAVTRNDNGIFVPSVVKKWLLLRGYKSWCLTTIKDKHSIAVYHNKSSPFSYFRCKIKNELDHLNL